MNDIRPSDIRQSPVWRVAESARPIELIVGYIPDYPEIPSILSEADVWETRLLEAFGRTIHYDIDWPGFTSHPDPQRNRFALTLLREHGVDHLYYAVTGLAEKNALFRQRVAKKVTSLRLEHVPHNDHKQITTRGHAIVLKMHLHEDYKGYLIIEEMQQFLPGLLGQMDDAPPPPASAKSDGRATSYRPDDESAYR